MSFKKYKMEILERKLEAATEALNEISENPINQSRLEYEVEKRRKIAKKALKDLE